MFLVHPLRSLCLLSLQKWKGSLTVGVKVHPQVQGP